MFGSCLVLKVLSEPKRLENRSFLSDVFFLCYKRPQIQDWRWDWGEYGKILASPQVCAELVSFQVALWNSPHSER